MITGKVVAVIPCYREGPHIADLVKATQPQVDYVIVADDNSDDETVLNATMTGARVVTPSPHNPRGVGGNTWSGIWFALCSGADIIITMDGDGQHNPADIPVLVEGITEGADIVIGSRFLGDSRSMPAPNRFANVLLTWMGNTGAPQQMRITDSQCGFRAFRKEVFRDIRTSENRFGFVVEMIIKARKSGLKVVEKPVTCIYPEDPSFESWKNNARRGVQLVARTTRWRLWEKFGM